MGGYSRQRTAVAGMPGTQILLLDRLPQSWAAPRFTECILNLGDRIFPEGARGWFGSESWRGPFREDEQRPQIWDVPRFTALFDNSTNMS